MALVQVHISVSKLARQLATVIDEVRMMRRGVTIMNGQREVARLLPPNASGASKDTLISLLQNSPLSDSEKASYADDIETIRSSPRSSD